MQPSAPSARLLDMRICQLAVVTVLAVLASGCSSTESDSRPSAQTEATMTLDCPSSQTTVTQVDRLEAASDTTLADVLGSWVTAEVTQRSARRALALVELSPQQAVSVGASTGVAEVVRDPSGGWAVNSLTTCLP